MESIQLKEVQALFAEAQRAADDARAAQAELDAALRELQAQEDARNQKTEELKRKSTEVLFLLLELCDLNLIINSLNLREELFNRTKPRMNLHNIWLKILSP